MFGLFKKQKNPTISWAPKRTRELRLHADSRQLNGIQIGCGVDSLSVFGNAPRFEIVDKSTYVLSYPSDGFALVISDGQLTTIDLYVSTDEEDSMQGCGDLRVTLNGQELVITDETTVDELIAAWGAPSHQDNNASDDFYSVSWTIGDCSLMADFTSTGGFQNLELHRENS